MQYNKIVCKQNILLSYSMTKHCITNLYNEFYFEIINHYENDKLLTFQFV